MSLSKFNDDNNNNNNNNSNYNIYRLKTVKLMNGNII